MALQMIEAKMKNIGRLTDTASDHGVMPESLVQDAATGTQFSEAMIRQCGYEALQAPGGQLDHQLSFSQGESAYTAGFRRRSLNTRDRQIGALGRLLASQQREETLGRLTPNHFHK